MKIRQGFVSNSSSSSFIISCTGKPIVTIEIDLRKYGDVIKSKSEFDDWALEEYGYRTIEEFIADNDCGGDYERVLAALENGKTIVAGRVCNDSGDPLEWALMEANLNLVPDNIEFIQEIGL